MATLLALMYVSRGVLRPDQLAATVTFGAPAILCAAARGGCGGAGCAGCGAACAAAGSSASAGACGGAGLLERLGLGEGAVRNVLMSRDIVPRAFACDYSLVADILRSWGPNWREHNCLNWSARKQMFVHLGRSVVLQPSPSLRFASEPGLPLLPPGGGAYELGAPTLAGRMASARARGAAAVASAPAGGSSAAAAPPRPHPREASSADEALAALMDNPHPLETLADPGAYLDSGSISRYHNPDNYCRALGRLLAERRVGPAPPAPAPPAAPAVAPRRAPRARSAPGGGAGAAAPAPPAAGPLARGKTAAR
jgi:hypothetical protein